jgi:hypothetical protein
MFKTIFRKKIGMMMTIKLNLMIIMMIIIIIIVLRVLGELRGKEKFGVLGLAYRSVL